MHKILTVSSSDTTDVLILVMILALDIVPLTSRSVGQLEAPPTIWPWIAVPRTVPRTSTIIPDSNTKRKGQHHQYHFFSNHLITSEDCDTYDKRWQSLSLSGLCWWTWWGLNMARESTAKNNTQLHMCTNTGTKGYNHWAVSIPTVCIDWKRQ